MPLQNRVNPYGDIFASSARGTMMGNRGGCFHSPDRTLTARRWASRQWICCKLDFKNRHRDVMAPNRYTELFFLDEATALAAGHRPCYECRRADAVNFADLWASAHGVQFPKAGAIDLTLHSERLANSTRSVFIQPVRVLPDGTMIDWQNSPALVMSGSIFRWTPDGYTAPQTPPPTASATVITPPSIVAVLAAGFQPRIHPTAIA